MSKSENGNAVASSAWLGRAMVWWLTLSMIPISWQLYDVIEQKGWARIIVGAIGCVNGIAGTFMIQAIRARRRRPNVRMSDGGRKTLK